MLDPRLRQLHDEPRSGGNQPAHQRMINRRFNDRASCFAQRRLYCEGSAKKKGEGFLRLLLETANIRVQRFHGTTPITVAVPPDRSTYGRRGRG